MARLQIGDMSYDFNARTGSGWESENATAKPFDQILLDRKLQKLLQKEANRIAKATNRAYRRYRTVTWTAKRNIAERRLAPVAGFKPRKWKVAQAYVVSLQTLEDRERVRRRRGRNEDATIFIERRDRVGRNAFLRVTRPMT